MHALIEARARDICNLVAHNDGLYTAFVAWAADLIRTGDVEKALEDLKIGATSADVEAQDGLFKSFQLSHRNINNSNSSSGINDINTTGNGNKSTSRSVDREEL